MKLMIPVLLLMVGCDIFGTVRPTGRPVSEAYGGAHELRILDVEAPLKAQRRIPLLSTPEVLAVYASAHVEGDVFFGERWVAIRLRDSEWYVDRLRDPDPPANGDAPPEAMRPLRELEWDKVVIPYKN
jgi:hypothetical protein